MLRFPRTFWNSPSPNGVRLPSLQLLDAIHSCWVYLLAAQSLNVASCRCKVYHGPEALQIIKIAPKIILHSKHAKLREQLCVNVRFSSTWTHAHEIWSVFTMVSRQDQLVSCVLQHLWATRILAVCMCVLKPGGTMTFLIALYRKNWDAFKSNLLGE